MITFGQLGAGQSSDEVSYSEMTLTGLIQELRASDMNLKIAIEKGDPDTIRGAGESVDRIVQHLLQVECSTKEECKALYGFLIERFVQSELEESSTGVEVCKKILKHFD